MFHLGAPDTWTGCCFVLCEVGRGRGSPGHRTVFSASLASTQWKPDALAPPAVTVENVCRQCQHSCGDRGQSLPWMRTTALESCLPSTQHFCPQQFPTHSRCLGSPCSHTLPSPVLSVVSVTHHPRETTSKSERSCN